MPNLEHPENSEASEVEELAAKTAQIWGIMSGRADIITDAIAGKALFETFKSASLGKEEK